MRVRGESVDKIDNDSLSVDSSVAEFRGADTAPYQFLHRTISHQPLSMVQQVQMEFEVCSDLRPEEQIRQHICEKAATSATGIVQRRLSTFTAS